MNRRMIVAVAALAVLAVIPDAWSNDRVEVTGPVKALTNGQNAVQVFSVDANGNIVSAGSGGAVTIADGADVVEGTASDAVSSAGGQGTISAKTRLMTSQLATIATNTGAATPAGTSLIGKVGIDQTTAGSTNATQQKQYAGVPSNFAVATADGTVFTLAAGEVGFVQNLDSADALAVKYGASASTSSFNFILPCGAAQDDGRGGLARIDNWVGVVSVATMTGTGRYIAWKIAP